MITVVHGKPRNGKSYVALRDYIVDELLYGRRYLVLGFPVKLPELNEWLQRKHPKHDIDLLKRVRVLTKEQVRKFWLYGPGNFELADVTKDQERAGQFADLETMQREFPEGILYVIDEAHIYFDARSWALIGLSLSNYTSQHGKLDHNCVFVTQHIDKLEKRIKVDAQEFVEVVNYGMRHIWTLFRMPARLRTMTRYAFPGPVDRNSLSKLDPELANCYDTMAGVAMAGARAPETHRKRGISVWWALPVVSLAVLAIMELPGWLVNGFLSSVPGASQDTPSAVGPSVPAAKQTAVSSAPVGEAPPAAEAVKVARIEDRDYTPDVRGLVVTEHGYRVLLADGYVLTETDGVMRGADVFTNRIELRDGRILRVRPGHRLRQ